jgi:hypothetical protein
MSSILEGGIGQEIQEELCQRDQSHRSEWPPCQFCGKPLRIPQSEALRKLYEPVCASGDDVPVKSSNLPLALRPEAWKLRNPQNSFRDSGQAEILPKLAGRFDLPDLPGLFVGDYGDCN